MGDSSDVLPSYFENGTAVFNVTDRDLSQFVKTIDKIESGGYVRGQGIFKLNVEELSRIEGTKSEELLRILKPLIKEKCVLQELRKYPLCDSCYGYRSCTPKTGQYIKKFEKKMACFSVYSAPKTCCSLILESCLEGPKSVVNHWFQEINSFSAKVRSGRSEHNLHDADEQKKHLETGVKVKAKYDRLLSLTFSCAEADVEKKPLFLHCTCEDCFSQSDPDTDSDTDSSRVKFMYPKKSVMLKYPRYAAGIQLKENSSAVNVTKNFSLSKIISVLDLLPNQYRGLTTSYFYIGEEHSCFAAHTEDGALYACNYLHLGFPKIWITIPPESCEKVRDSLKSLKMDLVHTSCVNSLNHKYYVFTLKFLDDLNVTYNITVQHVGQLVILEPNTIHWGFNCGPNIAEAVNFGTVSWIPEGVKAMRWRCRCFGDSSIHLDMRILVAAFYPEMLKSLYDFSGANTEVLKVSPEPELQLPEKKVHRKVKLYECPAEACPNAYRDHKRRLEEHVRAHHPDSAFALLNQIDALYPTKVSAGFTASVCEVCASLIRGSSTHLEKHYKRQLNNAKLNAKTKEDYARALGRLQQTVKRRKKAVKAKDNPE